MGALTVIVLLFGLAVLAGLGFLLYTVISPPATASPAAPAADTGTGDGILLQSATLPTKGILVAADGGKLCNQADGGLSLYSASGTKLWSDAISDKVARTVTVDGNGRLNAKSDTKTTYLNAPGPAGAYYLQVVNGTMGIYNSADKSVHEMIFPATGNLNGTLAVGTLLLTGQELWSPTGGHVLRVQNDGNVVLIAPGNHAVWSSNTADQLPKTVFVSWTGTLFVRGGAKDVVFGVDGPATGDYMLSLNSAGHLAVMQNDGTTVQNVIYPIGGIY